MLILAAACCRSEAQLWPPPGSVALPLLLAARDPATLPEEADEALAALVATHGAVWGAATAPGASAGERRAAREVLAQDLESYLREFPDSRYEFSIHLTLGTYYQRHARWSVGLPHLLAAWTLDRKSVV